MRQAVELGLELLTVAAGAGAVGAACLRHKAINHAVKFEAVVKSLAHQFFNTGDMIGGDVRVHFNNDIAVFELKQQCVFRIFDGVRMFDFFGAGFALGQLFGGFFGQTFGLFVAPAFGRGVFNLFGFSLGLLSL